MFSLYGLVGQSKSDIKLQSGQIWKYETRKGEERSRVVILKVEDYGESGIIVHISIRGLKIKNPRLSAGYSEEIGHLPFDKEALLKSLTELESHAGELPDFEDGYSHWKEAFLRGTSGVFIGNVYDAIDFVDRSMNK